MTAISLGHDHHPRAHHPLRAALVAAMVVAAVALAGGLIRAITAGDGETAAPVAVEATGPAATPSVTPASAPPDQAIGAWLTDHRAEVFPGFEGAYLGECPIESTGEPTTGLCSSLREDLGDTQIHSVGVYATDRGADVLLESSAEQWTVTAVSPWPELGTRYDGAPWSPITAITTWWHDRAADRYGAAAVHLHSCADAGGIGPNEQVLLCSTLVEDDGATRIYDSGRAGAPPDVRITVVEQPDRTWAVTETRVH